MDGRMRTKKLKKPKGTTYFKRIAKAYLSDIKGTIFEGRNPESEEQRQKRLDNLKQLPATTMMFNKFPMLIKEEIKPYEPKEGEPFKVMFIGKHAYGPVEVKIQKIPTPPPTHH